MSCIFLTLFLIGKYLWVCRTNEDNDYGISFYDTKYIDIVQQIELQATKLDSIDALKKRGN